MAITEKAKEYHEKMFPNYKSKFLETDPEFIERFDNFAFDEVTGQDDLDGKTRFIAILAALLGCQGIDEFRAMISAALNFDVTPVEIKEIVYQAAAYLGIGRYATEQYAAGNMHYEFQVESDDEIGYLAACLNYMASQIAGAEDDQKKFVANVSHDFRSPLTSIRGYLDAMIDGTIPPEMHDKYLNIVLSETERLTKLTNSLLSLNNLNTKGMLLDRTDFDINDIIRATAMSFEGTCRKKTIVIEMVLTGDELYVHADMEKIQQVLYNLLDNAIKFSHHDSVIRVETSVKNNKLFVSVKDTGIGIPKEDLKMIWNRFYKSDLSRGKDKKGTGLGLSIVKEIINCHGENINVISTEGVGSEFIFSLPLAEDEED